MRVGAFGCRPLRKFAHLVMYFRYRVLIGQSRTVVCPRLFAIILESRCCQCALLHVASRCLLYVRILKDGGLAQCFLRSRSSLVLILNLTALGQNMLPSCTQNICSHHIGIKATRHNFKIYASIFNFLHKALSSK